MSVGGVWGGSFDEGDEILVEEELSDVGDISTIVCAVRVRCSVEVSKNVDVGGSASIVTWEQGGELCNTLSVGWLETTEEGLVDVGQIRGVTIA